MQMYRRRSSVKNSTLLFKVIIAIPNQFIIGTLKIKQNLGTHLQQNYFSLLTRG